MLSDWDLISDHYISLVFDSNWFQNVKIALLVNLANLLFSCFTITPIFSHHPHFFLNKPFCNWYLSVTFVADAHSLFPTVCFCYTRALKTSLSHLFQVLSRWSCQWAPHSSSFSGHRRSGLSKLYHPSALALTPLSSHRGLLPLSMERRKVNPHHNRSQLQVICHRRDSNPIMCTQKTLNHAQAHTGVHEVGMHRC